MSGDTVLEIVGEQVDGVEIVRITGEVDLTNAGLLQDALEGTSARAVVLDLRDVAYLDSSGIRAIDLGYRRLLAANCPLAIVSPPNTAAGWTFRVAGFDRRLLCDSVDAALTAVEAATDDA